MNSNKLFYILIGVIIIVGLVHLYRRYVSVESFYQRVEKSSRGTREKASKSDLREQAIAEARAKAKKK